LLELFSGAVGGGSGQVGLRCYRTRSRRRGFWRNLVTAHSARHSGAVSCRGFAPTVRGLWGVWSEPG
jgi:hypothetical protein